MNTCSIFMDDITAFFVSFCLFVDLHFAMDASFKFRPCNFENGGCFFAFLPGF